MNIDVSLERSWFVKNKKQVQYWTGGLALLSSGSAYTKYLL